MWSPLAYSESAVISQEVRQGLLSRLDLMTIQPKVIVDLGSGTGEMSAALQARYPDSQVLALDISMDMLKHGQHAASVCANAYKLPFASESVDFVMAHFLLPWCQDMPALLQECHRILSPRGLIMLSALGHDTLREFMNQAIWPMLMDMHDVGDALQQQFADPVLDVDYYTTTYKTQEKCISELQGSGLLLPHQSLVFEQEQAVYEVTHEIIYAHAWRPPAKQVYAASADGVVRVPLSSLRRV